MDVSRPSVTATLGPFVQTAEAPSNKGCSVGPEDSEEVKALLAIVAQVTSTRLGDSRPTLHQHPSPQAENMSAAGPAAHSHATPQETALSPHRLPPKAPRLSG